MNNKKGNSKSKPVGSKMNLRERKVSKSKVKEECLDNPGAGPSTSTDNGSGATKRSKKNVEVKKEFLNQLRKGPSTSTKNGSGAAECSKKKVQVKEECLNQAGAGPSTSTENSSGAAECSKKNVQVIKESSNQTIAGPSTSTSNNQSVLFTEELVDKIVKETYENRNELRLQRYEFKMLMYQSLARMRPLHICCKRSWCKSFLSFIVSPTRNLPNYPPTPKYPVNLKPPSIVMIAGGGKDRITFRLLKFKQNQNAGNVKKFQLFCHKETGAIEDGFENQWWDKIREFSPELSLPLDYFYRGIVMTGVKYNFIIRALDDQNRKGDFSDPVGVLFTKSC